MKITTNTTDRKAVGTGKPLGSKLSAPTPQVEGESTPRAGPSPVLLLQRSAHFTIDRQQHVQQRH